MWWLTSPFSHVAITIFLLLQYAQSIPPSLRVNIDFIFLFSEPMHSNLQMIHKHFGGIVGSFRAFEALHRKLTENFGCMVIQLSRLQNSSVEKAVAFFKATQPGPYRLGCKKQWEFNRKFSLQQNRAKARDYMQINI